MTPRELQILQLIANGYTNREIAYTYGIGEQTVKNNVSHLLRKLEATNRAHAITLAIQTGLLPQIKPDVGTELPVDKSTN